MDKLSDVLTILKELDLLRLGVEVVVDDKDSISVRFPPVIEQETSSITTRPSPVIEQETSSVTTPRKTVADLIKNDQCSYSIDLMYCLDDKFVRLHLAFPQGMDETVNDVLVDFRRCVFSISIVAGDIIGDERVRQIISFQKNDNAQHAMLMFRTTLLDTEKTNSLKYNLLRYWREYISGRIQ